jgi:DNA modification methylase
MIIEIKKISELTPAPYNPRESTEKQESQLKQSLKKFGVVEPIIYNKQTGYIVGGHFRVRELQKLGYTEIECVIVDLSEEDEKELNIRLNANTGQWDWDELANNFELDDLNDWGLEVPNMKHELEAEEDDFDVDANGIETDIVLGDLFEIGEHRLLCGDSTDSDSVARLMDGEKADMVFTDPPYGISYKSNWASKDRERFNEIKNDDVILDILPSIILLSKNNIHWYIWTSHQVYSIWRAKFEEYYKSTIIWSKKSGAMGDLEGDYIVNYEMALFCHYGRKTLNGKRESAVWDLTRDSGIDYQHPTQKPISLAEKAIINSSNQNHLVADLFLGSGSTMVASHQLKRKCYGMELDPKYCQVIIDRMKKLDPTIKIKRNGVQL